MDKKIIEDVGVYWLEEHNTIVLYAEHTDGSEEEMVEIKPDGAPDFAGEEANRFAESIDYEYWYNEALEEAHRRGYILAGEAEGN